MAATIYGEAVFDIDYDRQSVQARDMQELYAIGQVILNRVDHLRTVPNDLSSFATTSQTPFKDETLDNQVNRVIGRKDQFASYESTQYNQYMGNSFDNQYEFQAARISLIAANRIGSKPGTLGTVPREYNYIFFHQDSVAPSPRADDTSRVKYGQHYFWNFKSNRIEG